MGQKEREREREEREREDIGRIPNNCNKVRDGGLTRIPVEDKTDTLGMRARARV